MIPCRPFHRSRRDRNTVQLSDCPSNECQEGARQTAGLLFITPEPEEQATTSPRSQNCRGSRRLFQRGGETIMYVLRTWRLRCAIPERSASLESQPGLRGDEYHPLPPSGTQPAYRCQRCGRTPFKYSAVDRAQRCQVKGRGSLQRLISVLGSRTELMNPLLEIQAALRMTVPTPARGGGRVAGVQRRFPALEHAVQSKAPGLQRWMGIARRA